MNHPTTWPTMPVIKPNVQVIEVIIQGGCVTDVLGIPPGLIVQVHDYDIEMIPDNQLHTDQDGYKFITTEFQPNQKAP